MRCAQHWALIQKVGGLSGFGALGIFGSVALFVWDEGRLNTYYVFFGGGGALEYQCCKVGDIL